MKLTRTFLTALQQRLAVESRRGIHLNAIPGRWRAKIDASTLPVFMDMHNLDQLFTAPMVIQIPENSLDADLLSRKLNHLFFEVQDIHAEKGIHTFGFGYPLLLRRDSRDKPVVAPLLIWSLQISKSSRSAEWTIFKIEEDVLAVNEVLVRHLQKEFGITLDALPDFISDDGQISKQRLEALLAYLSEKIKKATATKTNKEQSRRSPVGLLFEEGLKDIPSRQVMDKMKLADVQIHWGGLFGVFEVRHQNLLNDYDRLIQKGSITIDFENLPSPAERQLSLVKTDPAQQSVLNNLAVKRTMLIHGPPGTGKSQTLTAIIVTALTKGQKVLVVCGKLTALQVIVDHLEKLDLDHLTALVKDAKKDRRQLVNIVRQVVDQRYFYEGEGTLFANNDFEDLVKQQILSIEKRKQTNGLLQQVIWGDFTFGEIVALLLQIPNELRKSTMLLADVPGLKTISFLEWKNVTIILQQGEVLHENVNPFLDKYETAAFAQADEEQVQSKIQNHITKIKVQIEQVEHDFALFVNEAQQYFSNRYDLIYQQVSQQIDIVKSYLTNTSHQSSGRTETLTQDQISGIQYYSQLCEFLVEEKIMEYELTHTERPSEVLAGLSELSGSLNSWKRDWRHQMDDFVAALRQGEVPEELEGLPKYEKYQRSINILVDEFNAMGYFHENVLLQNNVDALLSVVQNRIDELEALTSAALSALQQWSLFYLSQSEKNQRLIDLFIGHDHWSERYSAFVLQHILQQQEIPDHGVLDGTIQTDRHQDLEKQQISFVQSQWRERQRVAAIRFQQQHRMDVAQLYNKRSTSALRKFTLREIVNKDLTLFQSFFPVVLATPEMASLLFSDFASEEIFDLVLFDEASQLKIEEGLPAFLKGKQRIIAGDEHQMPPSFSFEETADQNTQQQREMTATPSWLDYVMTLPNVAHQYLDFHYRSRHPALINFSNAAFYGDRLCPMPPLDMEPPINFRAVNGMYEEGLNEAEAADVVLLLKNIKRNADGFYPTVGIATFNIKQRNLILEKISALEAISPSFAAKLIALRNNDLFVKNLENIQGDERDLLIVSTVYGKGKDGKFAARFGPINRMVGYKLLNVLVTRAKHRIVVCSSIPEIVFLNYDQELEKQGNNRKAVFYAWLAYAKAISDGDSNRVEEVLTNLRKQSVTEKQKSVHIVRNNTFVKYVYDRLIAELENGQLLVYAKLGGFTIDLLYEASDGKRFVFIIDGWNESALVSSLESHEGIALIHIWSLDWWRDEDAMLEDLLQRLNLKRPIP